MTLITLLRDGLCLVGLILVTGTAVVLLATCLVTVFSLVYDDSIHSLGAKAREAIDQAGHEYLDHIYSNQMDKENQNEQLG